MVTVEHEDNLVAELATAMPEDFGRLTLLDKFPDKQKDRLLGIPVETDKNRTYLVGEIAKTIKEGKHFAVIYLDSDFLKSFNEAYGFLAGDDLIKNTTFTAAKVVKRLFKDVEGNIGFLRTSVAADETYVVITGLLEDQLSKVENLRKALFSFPPVKPPPYLKPNSLLAEHNLNLPFSFSSGVACSGEENFTSRYQEAKDWPVDLEKGSFDNKFYDFFEELRQKAKKDADETKVRKIDSLLDRLKEKKLDKERFIQVAARLCGDMRLGEAGLAKLLLILLEKQTKK